MTGIRIGVDLEALVHQSWKGLPWWRRLVLWFKPGARKAIEAEAVRRMKGGEADAP